MMVGSAGETGAKLLAGEYRERLLARLTPSFLARLDDFGAQCAPKGKVCLVPVEEGGVYAALWKLAEAAGAGLTVEQPLWIQPCLLSQGQRGKVLWSFLFSTDLW